MKHILLIILILLLTQNVIADTDTTAVNNADTWLDKDYPTSIHGGDTYFQAGEFDDDRIVLNFTLPAGSGTISEINLSIYRYYVGSSGYPNIIYLHNLTADFIENEATWNNRTTGVPWSTAGGDYDATIIDQVTPTGTNEMWLNLTIRGTAASNSMDSLTWGDTVTLITTGPQEYRYERCRSKENATVPPFITITYGTAGAPSITSYAPTGTIWPEVADSQLFNVTVNQSTQCRWYINGTLVETDAAHTEHSYTNTSMPGGVWNITADVGNANGNDTKTWIFEVGADSISYIVLQDTPTNQSMVFEVNITRVGHNVTDWGRWQNHTFDGWDYTFRYANGTAIKSLTAIGDNDTLWFNGTSLLPVGVYYIDATNDSVTFIDPTPANESTITVDHTTINASIKTSNLAEMIWNWNSTNTTFLNDSCVLHLSFDNNSAIGDSSTRAVDVSQYGNNGSFVNGSTGNWTTDGEWGGAMSFDGVNDYVNCGNDPSLNPLMADISFGAWVNTDSSSKYILAKAEGENRYFLGIYGGAVRFQLKDAALHQVLLVTDDTYNDSTWHHVFVTIDRDVVDGAKIYIDGDQKKSGDPTLVGNVNPSTNLCIGSWTDGSANLNASIDEVRVYDRAFSPAEVRQSYLSNLWKYNASQWYFESKQTALPDGEHNYQAFANNVSSDYWLLDVDAITPPASITNLQNTTGNFWHNWTWTTPGDADFNYTTLYINGSWVSNTSNAYYNLTATPHNQSTISTHTVDTNGNVNGTWVNRTSIIPNNPITITNTSGWSGDAGNNVYVDYDAIDADSDTPTFSCNRTDLFTDFSTSTGKGNWTAVAGTYYIDFGVSDGYGSTSNYTMTITVSAPPISITLHSVSPDTIQTNHTDMIQVNYIVESTQPLNLSTLALLYGINYTTTGDMHSYIAVPPNSIASEGIYRAPYRNTTPYLSWENNATITGGNVWQWGGGDNDSAWVNVTSINATHTWINATGHPEHMFSGSFYLGRRAMNTAPKTPFEINRQQGIMIKMWDNEAIRGRTIDYIMSMYFDSDWESTIPSHPIEIWGLNSSFNPDTDDPTTSEFGAKMVEWDGNRWVNHSWVPDSNASYAYPLVLNASSFPAIPDEINYIYLKSGTLASKSYILNATNYDPGICNITYAQTETMWTYNELSDVSDQVAYTPSFFTTFARDDEHFLHHLYMADDQGNWAHSGINNISIGVSHYPVAASSFEYFNITCPAEYDHDTYMDATYDSGYIYVGIYCHADPDGGTVSHNLTIHYANGTIAGIVNDTFTTTTHGIVEINFSTTPYYSTSDAYTLKCVSTDDEGSVATTWLGSAFTLAADGTQGYYMDTYLMFWGMNDVPTLYTTVNNNSLISYDAGYDIYTMHVPFFKSKCNDTFRFNETVHLKSLNTVDIAYFKFHGITIFDSATISAWDTVSDTVAPTTDAYRGYLIAIGGTWGNITNSDLSYLGSDIYRQEGLNFVDNTHAYLIYNTTFSHNGRGMIMEECENYNISHCNIHAPAEAGIGVYYTNNTVVENCTVSAPVHPGIYLYEANNNIIRYNTIQDCVDSGMRIRSNSNNNTLIGNDITGSGVYDYYFSSSSINNIIRDSVSTTDKIRVTSTSAANIENTDNLAFTEDSLNSTYAYPTNFSMTADSVSQTFDIAQRDMTVTPSSDSIRMWNLVWGNSISFNASNVSGAPYVWFNSTQTIWANTNMSVYRNGTIYYNGTADANGLFTYNYSGGWSGHWFEFVPENIAPDKPTVVVPANGATGTSTNPTLHVLVTDPNSYDTLNVTFYAQGGTQIGSTQTGLANGSTASVVWSGRSYSTTYYWYAVADDGTTQTQSDTWHFTTQTDGGDGGGGGGSSHVILISGCTDWEGNAGSHVYIDFGCAGETAGATFTTNAADGSIDSSSGSYTWNTDTADVGVYTWRFNVENVYTISDYCDVTITVYHYASPTNLAATTGNFWVNHTWDGNGYVDSYNVSVNDVWGNGSTDQHSYHVTTPHAWSNISVAAFNDTTGLSSFISSDVQVPNNAIVLTNYSVLVLVTAGDNVTVDMNHEDLDGDTATYYCSRMDLFTDFNTADGTGQYTNAVNGTHEVMFGVTDGYGWDNETITIEVGTVHPLELDEETPLLLFVVLVVLLFGSLFYIYHAASYVAKIVTALISTWMSFMLSNMAVSGNVVLNYAELSSGDVFVYGTHSLQIAALSHFFMFTGVVSALFMLTFAVKLVIDTYLNMQEKRKAEEEWNGVEEQ